jgi:radical SAM superfamily enzyme YgiQ (UPF0313 family)
MKVLLVNPNRYKSPPVPPIGLEYLASSLEAKSHDAGILDLCFSEFPYNDIDNAVASFKPDVAGITVRNVDTVLYHTNEFFLDEIKDIVNHIKSRHGLEVIIGGTGVSSNPSGILEYLNADYAIAGPAEDTIHKVLCTVRSTGNKEKVFRGEYRGGISRLRCSSLIDYSNMTQAG